MAIEDKEATLNLPASLIEAIEQGELTEAQLHELITLEAEALGLTFDEAVRLAREYALPKNAIGADLQLLIEMFTR